MKVYILKPNLPLCTTYRFTYILKHQVFRPPYTDCHIMVQPGLPTILSDIDFQTHRLSAAFHQDTEIFSTEDIFCQAHYG